MTNALILTVLTFSRVTLTSVASLYHHSHLHDSYKESIKQGHVLQQKSDIPEGNNTVPSVTPFSAFHLL